MKILIIGYGSIGQRHYKNLKKLGHNNTVIFDPFVKPPKKNENINFTHTLNQNQLKQFKIVFVCTPNHTHIKYALMAAKAGCHLFIEKPLSHNLKNVNKLIKLCQHKNIINMVACNMRFHPCIAFIKKYLNQNKLGSIYSISHEFGYYLPYWRPGKDYAKNYAAKKSTGGGIILDDIHEFDLLFWLNNFNPIKTKNLAYGKISQLNIQTEDICQAIFKFKNNIIGHISCNYLEQSYTRTAKIIGERGNIEWDWNQNIVWLKTKSTSKKLSEIKNWDLNQMYIDEIKYFLKCVKEKKYTFNNFGTAMKTLTTCITKNKYS